MSDLLAIGASGVRAYARALDAVADNVANAANPGHVRRTVTLAAAGSPALPGPLELEPGGGNGVRVDSIRRAADALLVDTVRRTESDVAGLNAADQWLTGVQSVLTGAASLAHPITGFFATLSDLSADPANIAARAAVLSSAEQLASRFQASAADLDRLEADMGAVAAVELRTLNDLAGGLAELNGQLRRASPGSAAAAQMADDRDRLLAQMATITTIDVSLNALGEATVRVPDSAGPLLVSGRDSRLVQLQQHSGALSLDIGGEPAAITGGILAGLSTGGRALAEARTGLDLLATRIATDLNAVHEAGVNLDGDPGGQLFSLQLAAATPARANGGTARAQVELDPGVDSPHLSLIYDGADWTLTDLDTGTSVTGAPPLSLSGATVAITGTARNGDMFTIERLSPAAAIHAAVTAPAGLAAAPAHLVDAAPGNLGQARAELRAGASMSAAAPFTATVIAGPLVELHDANGQLLASGAPGDWLAGDGFEIRLAGLPAEGDSFRVTPTPPGSAANGNAAALLAVGDVRAAAGTIAEQQDLLVSRIATATADVRARAQVAGNVRDNAAITLQQASGVDLNQEATEMLRLQQAYQANARIIQTAREIFSTILEAAR